MTQLDVIDLYREAFRLIRARLGTYVLVYSAAMVPMMAVGVLVMLAQWDFYTSVFRAMQQGAGTMPPVQPSGSAQFAGLLVYPIMIVVYPALAALTTRLSLDQLQGIERPVREVLPTLVRPILWIMLMDTVLCVVAYIGCICCCVPGIGLCLLYMAWLPLQSAVLCDQPIDWLEAGRRSKQIAEPHAGTFLGGMFFYFLLYLVLSLAMGLVAGVLFFAVNGGIDLTGPRFGLAVGIAYGAMILLSWVPTAMIQSAWFVWRAVAYHRLTRGEPVAQVAQVFS